MRKETLSSGRLFFWALHRTVRLQCCSHVRPGFSPPYVLGCPTGATHPATATGISNGFRPLKLTTFKPPSPSTDAHSSCGLLLLLCRARMKPARFTYSITCERRRLGSCGGLLFLGLASHGNTAGGCAMFGGFPSRSNVLSLAARVRLDASPCKASLTHIFFFFFSFYCLFFVSKNSAVGQVPRQKLGIVQMRYLSIRRSSPVVEDERANCRSSKRNRLCAIAHAAVKRGQRCTSNMRNGGAEAFPSQCEPRLGGCRSVQVYGKTMRYESHGAAPGLASGGGVGLMPVRAWVKSWM